MAGRIELAVFGHTTRDFIVTYDGRLQLGYLGGGGMNAPPGANNMAKDWEIGLLTRRAAPQPPPQPDPFERLPILDAVSCALRCVYEKGGIAEEHVPPGRLLIPFHRCLLYTSDAATICSV